MCRARSGLLAPTLHEWAGGPEAAGDGALGWAGAATKDMTQASKKHEAVAQKELAKLKRDLQNALQIETRGAREPGMGIPGGGFGVAVVALLLVRCYGELNTWR